LVAAPAQAGEWNLYTPCHELELTAQQTRDYAIWRLCDPGALEELHRGFGAPPLAKLARSGRAVRVSAVDAGGHSLVAIDAVEHRGRAFAIVRGASDGRRRPSVRRNLSDAAWDYVASGAARLETVRAVAPIHSACRSGLDLVVETHGFGVARTLRGK